MMPGLMQQREDEPVVPDQRMKSQPSENVHETLSVCERRLGVHGADRLQDAVMHARKAGFENRNEFGQRGKPLRRAILLLYRLPGLVEYHPKSKSRGSAVRGSVG